MKTVQGDNLSPNLSNVSDALGTEVIDYIAEQFSSLAVVPQFNKIFLSTSR